jgi:hypothetical protein
MGQLTDNYLVEIHCKAEPQANYYQWARFENFPKSTILDNDRLFINNFTSEDSGIYGCRANTDKGDLYTYKLIASNDYLLNKNPFFSFTRENTEYITVRCRTGNIMFFFYLFFFFLLYKYINIRF